MGVADPDFALKFKQTNKLTIDRFSNTEAKKLLGLKNFERLAPQEVSQADADSYLFSNNSG